MRGLGKKQEEIKEKMFWKIYGCIADINFDHRRFATMNDIRRETGINMDSIRKHIDRAKKSMIKEYSGYNNARYFYTWEAEMFIKKHKTLWTNFLSNTQYHIYELKYPNPSKFTKPVKSSRDYGSLTEKQERKIEKNKLQKLKDSKS